MCTSIFHIPVLLEEVLAALPLQANKIADMTLGGANHSLAMLQALPQAYLFACDKDQHALQEASNKLKPYNNRVNLFLRSFEEMGTIWEQENIQFDFILADLGVSSHQLDTQERGFSFRLESRLDMRMNQQQEKTAFHIVNQASQEEIKYILSTYGEESYASLISKRIIEKREIQPIQTTKELADLIFKTIPRSKHKKIHPATKSFQALRIAVNNELTVLKTFLQSVPNLLRSNGKVAIISFHSLEDRIVKQQFANWVSPCTCPVELPLCVCHKKPTMRYGKIKRIKPKEQEIKANPRSRSATLRILEKI